MSTLLHACFSKMSELELLGSMRIVEVAAAATLLCEAHQHFAGIVAHVALQLQLEKLPPQGQKHLVAMCNLSNEADLVTLRAALVQLAQGMPSHLYEPPRGARRGAPPVQQSGPQANPYEAASTASGDSSPTYQEQQQQPPGGVAHPCHATSWCADLNEEFPQSADAWGTSGMAQAPQMCNAAAGPCGVGPRNASDMLAAMQNLPPTAPSAYMGPAPQPQYCGNNNPYMSPQQHLPQAGAAGGYEQQRTYGAPMQTPNMECQAGPARNYAETFAPRLQPPHAECQVVTNGSFAQPRVFGTQLQAQHLEQLEYQVGTNGSFAQPRASGTQLQPQHLEPQADSALLAARSLAVQALLEEGKYFTSGPSQQAPGVPSPAVPAPTIPAPVFRSSCGTGNPVGVVPGRSLNPERFFASDPFADSYDEQDIHTANLASDYRGGGGHGPYQTLSPARFVTGGSFAEEAPPLGPAADMTSDGPPFGSPCGGAPRGGPQPPLGCNIQQQPSMGQVGGGANFATPSADRDPCGGQSPFIEHREASVDRSGPFGATPPTQPAPQLPPEAKARAAQGRAANPLPTMGPSKYVVKNTFVEPAEAESAPAQTNRILAAHFRSEQPRRMGAPPGMEIEEMQPVQPPRGIEAEPPQGDATQSRESHGQVQPGEAAHSSRPGSMLETALRKALESRPGPRLNTSNFNSDQISTEPESRGRLNPSSYTSDRSSLQEASGLEQRLRGSSFASDIGCRRPREADEPTPRLLASSFSSDNGLRRLREATEVGQRLSATSFSSDNSHRLSREVLREANDSRSGQRLGTSSFGSDNTHRQFREADHSGPRQRLGASSFSSDNTHRQFREADDSGSRQRLSTSSFSSDNMHRQLREANGSGSGQRLGTSSFSSDNTHRQLREANDLGSGQQRLGAASFSSDNTHRGFREANDLGSGQQRLGAASFSSDNTHRGFREANDLGSGQQRLGAASFSSDSTHRGFREANDPGSGRRLGASSFSSDSTHRRLREAMEAGSGQRLGGPAFRSDTGHQMMREVERPTASQVSASSYGSNSSTNNSMLREVLDIPLATRLAGEASESEHLPPSAFTSGHSSHMSTVQEEPVSRVVSQTSGVAGNMTSYIVKNTFIEPTDEESGPGRQLFAWKFRSEQPRRLDAEASMLEFVAPDQSPTSRCASNESVGGSLRELLPATLLADLRAQAALHSSSAQLKRHSDLEPPSPSQASPGGNVGTDGLSRRKDLTRELRFMGVLIGSEEERGCSSLGREAVQGPYSPQQSQGVCSDGSAQGRERDEPAYVRRAGTDEVEPPTIQVQ